ncbi:MAG: sugar phosphate nucleotidyltransferase, partial [Chloroflexota bacterium]|nr:sugar phosphate nucleotidyltransferase [Chloroflexota bacterium]
MSEQIRQAVILAAGKGKRLHPVTPQRSKAMAPVAGKPIVERVLDTLVDNGIRHCILIVGPDDAEIVAYFQQRNHIRFDFVIQSERLGMAHALSLAAPHLHGAFILSACDNLVPAVHVADLLHTHRATGANATLSLLAIDRAHAASTGIVEWDGTWVRRIVEKPTPAEAPSDISSLPLYLFSPKLLDYLPLVKPSPRGEYELQDAIQLLIANAGRVTGMLTPGRLQLTNTADLLALNRHYLAIEPDAAQILTQAIGSGTRLIPPVRIEAGSTIGADCVIGPYVTIERDCQIGAG